MRIPARKSIQVIREEGISPFAIKSVQYFTNGVTAFRIRSALNSFRYHNYAEIDPHGIIDVNPQEINVSTTTDLPVFDPNIFTGTVARGRWERSTINIESTTKYNNVDKIRNPPSKATIVDHFEAQSTAKFDRCSVGDSLEISKFDDVQEYPPTVNIDRNGQIQVNTGLRQFLLASGQKIDSIPTRVCVRHRQWQRFRDQVKYYIINSLRGESYNQLPHPDLQFDAEHNSEQRFDLIDQALDLEKGTVLDIGSHMDGYFCHRLEEMGFDCYAVERNRKHVYFLGRFRRMNQKHFTIVNVDILESPENIFNRTYDVCLALNIFHHFLKSKERYVGFLKVLDQLDADIMFFQSHTEYYVDSWRDRGHTWFKTFVEDQFAEFILDHTQFNRYELLGRPEDDNRPLYKLMR